MSISRQIILGAMAAASLFAGTPTSGFQKVSAADAERLASVYNGPRTRVAMWVWTDRNVYQPGQAATIRWTVKTNNDLYPYTIVAYRQNNQNGRKFYLPGGGEDATDINGSTVAQGFQPAQLADVTKAVVAANVTIPNEPGMHTIVVELRDYTGTRVVKAAYMKVGVVTGVQTLTGEITADRTLNNTTQWNLSGAVIVKNNATLTIEPGTFIIGQPGSQPPSVLVVSRTGRINAAGTKSRPIIMTSSQPFGQRRRGDWGGLIMLGRAPINVGANAASANNPAGEFFIEGLTANPDFAYGGTDPNHSCGVTRYVRVEFGGSILSPNNETNSFTWGGCGRGTIADHLQATYGLDDSFEWFGGTADAKYLVGGLGADDYIDYQLGYVGRIQYGIFYQSADSKGNRGIEGDNSEYNQAATPYSNPTMFNLTFIGAGQPGFDEANSPGIFLRRGARGSINNAVVSNFFSGAIDLNDAATQAEATAGNITMNGILIWKNNIGTANAPDTLPGQITQAFTLGFAQGTTGTSGGRPAAQNIVVTDPALSRPFEYSDPDFSGLFGSSTFRAGWIAPPDDGFFDQSARFVGGIGDENWVEEWTNFLIEPDIAP